jgi:hypothetical protein
VLNWSEKQNFDFLSRKLLRHHSISRGKYSSRLRSLFVSLLLALLPLVCVAKSIPAHTATTPANRIFEPSLKMQIQIMLDRKGYSPGEIDGNLGSNTKKALAAFQRYHGLKPTGLPDPITLEALQEGSPEVLKRYRIDDDDVAGPFTPKIPRDMIEKTKLSSLEYRSSGITQRKISCQPRRVAKDESAGKISQG